MKKNEFLKELRTKHKLSRLKIGILLGVSSSYIEKLELGVSNITPTTKYIQGICALYGYNPEIFNYDDITPELLKKFEFSKFHKVARKINYFSKYPNIEYDYSDKIPRIINKHKEDNEMIINIGHRIFNYNYFSAVSFPNILILSLYLYLDDYHYYEIIKDDLNVDLENKDKLFFELLFIIALEKFKPSEFGNIDKYINIINYKDEFIKKWNFTDDKLLLNYSKDTFKDKLLKMEKNGLEVDISTIRYAYKYIQYKNLENEVKQLEKELSLNPAEVTNPKIKEICDLLEYAPDTFKDKIIQKLNEYKQLEDF